MPLMRLPIHTINLYKWHYCIGRKYKGDNIKRNSRKQSHNSTLYKWWLLMRWIQVGMTHYFFKASRSRVRVLIGSNQRLWNWYLLLLAKHSALRRKSKDWLTRNQNKVCNSFLMTIQQLFSYIMARTS
jgi:hypothetical protein